ncbi:hypothetical protein PC116_g22185 [Phytophthora cactorum]|uniref:Uncharacterized protein n=1 Tax=Phytophthora cactorum TaxID=29920 RepID=A0A8T1K0Z5_9STRA|nr:hypothetical protein PC114_g19774 [Phytophthora cactorum]KAG3077635.1 hypothetical protein PI125_g21206 [Phytophthora idaei]KAG2910387.1 hypothetical protein PC117_g19414 [Phytophthora cactorum]KAG2989457.1 hypothetical protein PC119_g19281 [Phytophthora cactorum]KAG3007314.1 hypothetical protein PC120_g16898 [Phytophthora cactorum]
MAELTRQWHDSIAMKEKPSIGAAEDVAVSWEFEQQVKRRRSGSGHHTT